MRGRESPALYLSLSRTLQANVVILSRSLSRPWRPNIKLCEHAATHLTTPHTRALARIHPGTLHPASAPRSQMRPWPGPGVILLRNARTAAVSHVPQPHSTTAVVARDARCATSSATLCSLAFHSPNTPTA
eukprot:m.542526 g.542526  ORF g.542526 m.542526 type:complete len:131 (+) comp57656_c0_seq34:63-455(+)